MEVSKLFVTEFVDFSLNPPIQTNISDHVYDYITPSILLALDVFI